MSTDLFHPAVKSWFDLNFKSPTACQTEAWPSIRDGRHTLIAAPTGSGKTLAAFLAVIDSLVQQGTRAGGLADETRVVYLSPLKALSNDIHRNLEQPLHGIGLRLLEMGYPSVPITSMVRTGDTPAASRTAMTRNPPHILVTTPESLYLLLTSERGRRMLKTVSSVIVDEIHAVACSKRGSHLALSLQRLQHLAAKPLTRIGLSATQRPIAEIARFLLGSQTPLQQCSIIDSGHRRELDLAIELPSVPLEAVLSAQASGEIYDRIRNLVEQHRTSLIFVNTRRMAERVARHLSERLDSDSITSHHGSLAREQRLDAETRLKEGRLRALVATASLELGIDIGDVDLVCQIGTTGSIATLLQRVGRSGHSTGGLPKGRIFPTSRDELVECIALLDSVRLSELDALQVPHGPLDVLAQQMVAMIACEEWDEDALYALIRQSHPYRNLERADYDALLRMLAHGFHTRRGRRSAYVYHDTVHRKLRARKSARLTAVTCGGAIPDNADYRVLLQPGGQFIGTVDEDFAMESLAGDIFQLGNNSWKVLRLQAGDLLVEDARDQPPSIPFWFGEAPGRTPEVSASVSRLRTQTAAHFRGDKANLDSTIAWMRERTGINPWAARQAVSYLGSAQIALNAMPAHDTLVLERFFDESGGMQLILHAPFGSRINRAWGLALRKRFCRTFNFELQAAATENSIILSLGTSQSFELAAVARYLNPASVRDVLIQALLDAPMFNIRWRWNCTCSLAVRRFQGGRKTPPYLVRMQSEDLVTCVFPEQLACQENLTGEREIPSHPLVRQTIDDCLHEVMDIDGLRAVLERIQNGAMQVEARDLVEPSPFAAEILSARNYAFLDGAPAEERRTRAVISRRWLDPQTASDLGRLDEDAIRRVFDESWPQAGTPDELHDALLVAGFIDEQTEGGRRWTDLFAQLVADARACRFRPAGTNRALWIASENLPALRSVYAVPASNHDRDEALSGLLRARLGCTGPVSTETLAALLALPAADCEGALLRLESEGSILRGRFTPDSDQQEWCERRLLARIHQYTIGRLRKQIEAVDITVFMRFLFRWQRLGHENRMQGTEALLTLIRQLEGFEASAAAWESEILPARLQDYNPDWLDQLCTSGRISWSRRSRGSAASSTLKSSPITLIPRRHLRHWLQQPGSREPTGCAQRVAQSLQQRGASFFEELVEDTGLLPVQLENALAELVAAGFASCDSFSGLRALLVPEKKRRGRLRPVFDLQQAGRWTLIRAPAAAADTAPAGDAPGTQDSVEHCANVLLARYGVVFRALLTRESLTPAWNELLVVLRRMEARGDVRGGRFVSAQYGEQFALPGAVEALRKLRGSDDDEYITINATDPLNLHGILAPGDKIPAHAGNRVLYRNGIAIACQQGKTTRFLQDVDADREWEVRQHLVRNLSLLKLTGDPGADA